MSGLIEVAAAVKAAGEAVTLAERVRGFFKRKRKPQGGGGDSITININVYGPHPGTGKHG
jgi:hypothetical protein